MSSPHQALYGAMISLRTHLSSANSLKIAGAFACGVACTGVVMVAWSGSLGSIFSGTEQPERAQIAAVTPQVPAAGAGAASSKTEQNEATASKPADSTSRSADAAADQVRCEDQVWPYIDQRCLTKAESDSAAPSRSVRIVSTDKTIASDPKPAPSRTAEASSAIAASSAPQTADLPPAAEAQPSIRSADRSTTKRRQQRGDDRLAQRHDGRDDGLPQQRLDGRDHGLPQRRLDGRGERMVQPRHEGRQVTVEQTYRLPDGRRVVVRRFYRTMPARDFRALPDGDFREVEASNHRRPFARYHSMGPSGFVADD